MKALVSKQKADYRSQNELYLFTINDADTYKAIEPILKKMGKECNKLIAANKSVDKMNLTPYTQELIKHVERAVQTYPKGMDVAFSKLDIRQVAKDIARYYANELFYVIQSENASVEEAKAPEWFDKMSKKSQEDYLKKNPDSDLKRFKKTTDAPKKEKKKSFKLINKDIPAIVALAVKMLKEKGMDAVEEDKMTGLVPRIMAKFTQDKLKGDSSFWDDNDKESAMERVAGIIVKEVMKSKEESNFSNVSPVVVSGRDFKREFQALRVFFGNIRVLRHPVLTNTMVMYSGRIGTLTRPMLFRIESELKKIDENWRMTNIWKNDPIYTANPDKSPDYTGCQFMLRRDKEKTKIINIDIPGMSLITKLE